MPKFLYILLLVNLANACQSEHSGRAGNPGAAPQHQQDSLVHSTSATQREAEKVAQQSFARSASDQSADSSATNPLDTPPLPALDSLENKAGQEDERATRNAQQAQQEPSLSTEPKEVGQQIFTQWDALFADMDQFFQENVIGGRVRYGDVAVSPAVLNDLVLRISTADLSKANAAQIKTFKINSYNVLVIHQVVEHYPIPSPMDIAGFFDGHTYMVAGKKSTLNDLEAGLRSDARVHFALICGALGCPKIMKGAFMPAKLDQQLDLVTRQALNDPTFLRYQDGDQYAELSQIFNWYAEDFGGKESLITYINKYRTVPIPEETSVSYYDYNWKLNKTP